MPVLEIAEDNIPANTVNLNVINGERASQVDMNVRGAVIRLLAVASAVALEHALWVGGRNPLSQSVIPVSATPNLLEDPENQIIGGVTAVRGETIRLLVTETAGVATNDYRARIVVSEIR
tara:strand:- start:80 stop:439 length:360 start_codon:yes stop_codon:yes gene_type:complete